jgi:hypothetical protein
MLNDNIVAGCLTFHYYSAVAIKSIEKRSSENNSCLTLQRNVVGCVVEGRFSFDWRIRKVGLKQTPGGKGLGNRT